MVGLSRSTTLALCYFNCCYFEEWRFSKLCHGCPRRMDERWIIDHLCGNTLSVRYGGCIAPYISILVTAALVGDWWRGILHRASTSSRTPSLGLPLSPVHGALGEYDWQRWSPHALTNYSPPDGLMCIVWIRQTPLSIEMRDECVLIRSCVACTTLIIIFIDEYHCRQDDEVAICVQRLSEANMERGLCHWREIYSRTDLRALCRSNLH